MRKKLDSILFNRFLPLPLLQAGVGGPTPSEAEQLAQTGQAPRFFKTNGSPQLTLECSPIESDQNQYASVDHTIGVEALHGWFNDVVDLRHSVTP